ncbi:MAG TPA: protein kinase [Gammaproteobacteria bacterium]|nr:protein kinase [Gammaproteobacteria bacterium]
MDGFRSLCRSLFEAAALGLLATAVLYLPPALIASRLDGWLFDTWSLLEPPPAAGDILLVEEPTPGSFAPLAKVAKRRSPLLLISTVTRPPAGTSTADPWMGPTELPLGGTRARTTHWSRGGHLWFEPDVDGVIRHDQMLGGHTPPTPSLPLYAAQALATVDGTPPPPASTASRPLRFGAPHAFQAVAEKQVLDRPELLDHSIVIAGSADRVHLTPVGLLSSPELVAHVLANYREQRWLDGGLRSTITAWGLAAVLLLPLAFLGWRTRAATVGALAVATLVMLAASAAAFTALDLWLPVTGPAAWLVLTGALLVIRQRPRPVPSGAGSAESGNLVDARRAAAAGRHLEAWAVYRRVAPGAALLPELYDLASALAGEGCQQEAADLFYRIAQVDSRYRDVAHRLVRASHPAPSADDEPFPVPQTLGRYQLLEPIGHGATGYVYLARDPVINRIVALKVIDLSLDYDGVELESLSQSFLREASIAGGLNHPNIVTIFDVGQTEGLAYIAMEYLKGRHLSDFAVPEHLLPVDVVLELLARAATALDYAHAHSVVHRDIKPANIMYDSLSDSLKITDFGIAKLIDANRTRTGIVLGTPAFMSPEQLEGRNVNGHTDLFALGVSLYQLLTGYLPFRGASMTKLMFVIANEPHQPVTTVRTDLPKWLDDVVDRALAKDPANRYQSGAEMAAALRRGHAKAA